MPDLPGGVTGRQSGARPDGWPLGLPEHVTTPLLDLIVMRSLDEDYRQVALRKAGTAPAAAPARPRWVAAGVVAAFGVLITVAAVQTSANAEVVDASRATLIGRIADERDQARALQERIGSLQDDTIVLEADLEDLDAALRDAAALQRRLEVRTGYVAVRGPGVRVTVDDNPQGDVNQLVRADDLALLVDGLWAAGAEAVAVNDERLSTLVGLHNRGIAVEVGSQPVNPPYTVEAIGDVDTLAADLLDTTHGSRFFELAAALGFVHSVQNDDELALPAARGPVLRYVTAGTGGKPGMDDEEKVSP